jgi:hypothetical protein
VNCHGNVGDSSYVLSDFIVKYHTNLNEIAELEQEFIELNGKCGILISPLAQRIMQIDCCEINLRELIV